MLGSLNSVKFDFDLKFQIIKVKLEILSLTVVAQNHHMVHFQRPASYSSVIEGTTTRTRERLNATEIQERVCACSDLIELPRPRILLLGKNYIKQCFQKVH